MTRCVSRRNCVARTGAPPREGNTASGRECAISGSVARCLLSPVLGDVFDQPAQRAEDVLVLLAVGAQLYPVLLGDHQGDLEDIDRVQSQALTIEGLVRVDLGGCDVEIQGLDNEAGDLTGECSGVRRGDRLPQRHNFIGHLKKPSGLCKPQYTSQDVLYQSLSRSECLAAGVSTPAAHAGSAAARTPTRIIYEPPSVPRSHAVCR